MSFASGFDRVSRDRPCPICGRPDWCLIARDAAAAICPRRSEGALRQVGDAGYLHRLGGSRLTDRRPQVATARLKIAPPELAAIADQSWRTISFAHLNVLHHSLGVTTSSLEALGVGWFAPLRCWTFPMRDTEGHIIGIRTRTQAGRKFAVKGSRQGLFVPANFQAAAVPWLITEGASDCAAGLDLGFQTVGLPSANGGSDLLTCLVAKHKPEALILCADNDSIGQQGMLQLAARLRLFVRDLRIITPPTQVKDLRDWMRAGLTHELLQNWVRATEPFDLHLSTKVGGTS